MMRIKPKKWSGSNTCSLESIYYIRVERFANVEVFEYEGGKYDNGEGVLLGKNHIWDF